MKAGIVISVTGQYKICDTEDDNAPLITFHNEFNNHDFVVFILDCIREDLRKTEVKSIKQSIVGKLKFEYLDIEEE